MPLAISSVVIYRTPGVEAQHDASIILVRPERLLEGSPRRLVTKDLKNELAKLTAV